MDQLKTGDVLRMDRALGYVNLVVPLPLASARQLAARPDVVSIQPYTMPRKLDETQSVIVAGLLTGNVPTAGTNYLSYLASKGFSQAQFDASGFLVDVTDSGIDNGTTSPNHPALYSGGNFTNSSRVIYNRLEGTPHAGSTLQGCDGHGNLNAHILGGFVPDSVTGVIHRNGGGTAFRYGLGVCPFVRIGNSVIFDPDNYTSPNFEDMLSRQYSSGTRVNSNSWGGSEVGAYDSDAQRYDALVRDAQPAGSAMAAAGNQEMVIVFVAGNDGPGPQTINSPGTGKNVITVGASENVQPFGGTDCLIGDSGADSANDIIFFSSRGPCGDGRHKPDLVAPGTHVTGGVFQAAQVMPPFSGNGVAGACFNGSGVCGGVGIHFFPTTVPQQQYYTASTGTSHSTPAVAGAAALIRQAFINHGLSPASPAMTKAALMNSARYMTGANADDDLWSNTQGMGAANLDGFFDMFVTPTIFKDAIPADIFTATGQQKVITGTISDSGKPFRVTLTWTDPPGPTSGNAFVNNLDLVVTAGGNTYLGNVFSGAFSATGGVADGRNNVESVFLPAGVSGSFSVAIKATNIAGDGVPNSGGPLDQDYAVVVYNAVESPQPVIVATGISITGESCVPNNGAFDPGETVTVGLTLQNIGTLGSGNVTASLEASANVLHPSGPQSYRSLGVGASATSSFTLTVNPSLACGANLSLTWDVNSGSGAISSLTLSRNLGALTPVLSENFDGVAAPALPSGWSAFNASGPFPLWLSSTTTPSTAPNDAFVDDPGSVSDKWLNTPSFLVNSASAQMMFSNNYNLENGFDGGVLEIQFGPGVFTDILAAGGSFVSGGYNGTISTGFQSPIAGRQAWTGNSGGYQTAVVNLPPAANGQMVTLRFRMGSDNRVSGTGWRIDGVSVLGGYACCSAQGPDLAISKTHTGSFTQGQTTASYTIMVSNVGSGATAGSVTVTDAVPMALTATAIGGSGWSCTQPSGPCTRGDILAAGSSYAALTLTVNVAANAPTSVTNTATVSGGGDTMLGNNSAADLTSVQPVSVPDLTITKTHVPLTFTQGQTGTYTITVSNAGTASTSGLVTVMDALPGALTATSISGAGWSCAQPAGPCTRNDILPAGSSYAGISLSVNVAANAVANVTNTATVAGGGEINTSNDTASDLTVIGPLVSSVSPNPVETSAGAQTLFINGSGFVNGAGLSVAVNGVVFNPTFLSATQLSIGFTPGASAANESLQVFNPDGRSSNVFSFTVEVPHTTTFALPQFVFGGNTWYTAIYFANTTNSVAHVQVNFYSDAGTPMLVPLLGIGSVSSQGVDVNPNSTAILEAPNNAGDLTEGWAEVALPTGVAGYAVFRQSVPGRADQEAAVPLTPETSLTADLTYDDIQFTTSVAFLNPSAQPETVTINTFDASGAPNGSTQTVLPSRGKVATILKNLPGLSGIAGNRGRAVFSVASGAVSVLGLRFGGSAFTSIPVIHRPAVAATKTISLALPQVVFGGSWYTALYFSNTTGSTVEVPVSFTSDAGAALGVTLLGIGTVTSQTVTLNPGATAILEAPLTDLPGEGWAEAMVPPGVIGYAIFRQTIAGRADQEAAVPLTAESNQVANLVYDDIEFTTSVAFLNPSDQQTIVTITVCSADGTPIGIANVALASHAKVATILKDVAGLGAMAGNRGLAVFSVPNGDVSVLGLRFGGQAFTSIPVQ